MRKQLRQPFAAKATVEAAISKLESGLRAQSQVRDRAGVGAACLHAGAGMRSGCPSAGQRDWGRGRGGGT